MPGEDTHGKTSFLVRSDGFVTRHGDYHHAMADLPITGTPLNASLLQYERSGNTIRGFYWPRAQRPQQLHSHEDYLLSVCLGERLPFEYDCTAPPAETLPATLRTELVALAEMTEHPARVAHGPSIRRLKKPVSTDSLEVTESLEDVVNRVTAAEPKPREHRPEKPPVPPRSAVRYFGFTADESFYRTTALENLIGWLPPKPGEKYVAGVYDVVDGTVTGTLYLDAYDAVFNATRGVKKYDFTLPAQGAVPKAFRPSLDILRKQLLAQSDAARPGSAGHALTMHEAKAKLEAEHIPNPTPGHNPRLDMRLRSNGNSGKGL